jgi:hypothetical protein
MSNSGEPAGFYEYADAELSMRLPLYLGQKKRGTRFFEALSKKRKDNPLHGFSIEFLNEAGVKAHREIMTFKDPRTNEERMGVRGQVIRRGKPSYLDDGLEVLGATQVTATGETLYGYQMLFPLGSRHVYAAFFGQGELAAFEESCKEIVSSVRLAEVGDAQPPARSRRWARSGLGHADMKRLKQALDGLPAQLTYLRRPILAMATQDQDLLGSGEGDVAPIERALRKTAKRGGVESIASDHAKLLHEWLVALHDHESAWAAPAFFVEGVLRGRAGFGPGSAEP